MFNLFINLMPGHHFSNLTPLVNSQKYLIFKQANAHTARGNIGGAMRPKKSGIAIHIIDLQAQPMQKIKITISQQQAHSAQSFQCYEALNQAYTYLIRLSEQCQQAIIGKPLSAALYFNDSQEPRYFHGIVHEYQQQPPRIICTSWLGLLQFEQINRRFINKSIPTILQEIFKQHQFHDYNMQQLKQPYQKHHCICQYQETTLQLINRLCQLAGIYYWFEQSTERATLKFVDSIQSLHVKHAPRWQQLSTIYKTKTESTLKAISHQTNIYITTLINLKDQAAKLPVVTQLFHKMDVTQQRYTCYVTASNWPATLTPIDKPHIHGIQTATVMDHRANQIQCRFDWEQQRLYQKGHWIDYCQPFASNGVGMQFTPDIGHQVIIMFINGDPEQPVAIGSLYNATHKPPYPLPQFQNNMTLKSKSGNEVSFIDTGNKSKCIISASHDYYEMISKNRHETIHSDQIICAKNKYRLMLSKGCYTINAKQKITLTCGDSKICITADKITFRANMIYLN